MMSQEINHNLEVPDFEAAQIDPYIFKNVFQRFECILVRNLLDKSLIYRFHEIARDCYNRADMLTRTGTDLGISFKEHGHISAHALGTKNGQAQVLKMFRNSPIPSLYKEILGPDIRILTGNSLPRRQDPGRHNPPVPFHQDASFLGNSGLIINSWIPLNQAGFQSPGIQVLLRPQSLVHNQSNFEIKSPTTYAEIEISDDPALCIIDPKSLWAPIIDPGDVLFFSHLAIHRTYQTDSMTLQRISLEIRSTGK